jgi:HprK-related kinase A
MSPTDVAAFERALASTGLGFRMGPFDLHLKARVRGLAPSLYRLYRHYPLLDSNRVFSLHLEIFDVWRPALRGRRRVRVLVDGQRPHEDMPAAQALAVLEWAQNLVIAMRFHRFLMLHSAVLERNGRALLMPAAPGHGKTTLCAALALRGWRFFSDEFGLLHPGEVEMFPVPRPMPLKNASIQVIRRFEPAAELGPEIVGTIKGTVAHLLAPAASVAAASQSAPAGWIVFPRWQAGAATALTPVDPASAFMQLARNAFNYEMAGEAGFASLRQIVESAPAYSLVYSELDEAVAVLAELADRDELAERDERRDFAAKQTDA